MNTAEINTQFVTVTPPLSPYALGMLDAQEGLPFAPEVYFLGWWDKLEYTEGFEAVRGESEVTKAFKLQWPEPEPAIEDDAEWIRRGC